MLTSSWKLALALGLGLAVACDKGVVPDSPRNDPGLAPPDDNAPAATVTLTSVRFADDCSGAPPSSPPVPPPAAITAPAPSKVAPPSRREPGVAQTQRVGPSPADRACEQTSMQLSIAATRASEIQIKSVEVFDESGASLGTLATSVPTRWSDAKSIYEAWDGKVEAGQTAQVSYVLQQPLFVKSYDPRDRTYTVKVLASVGGRDQPLQTTVMVVGLPAPVPT